MQRMSCVRAHVRTRLHACEYAYVCVRDRLHVCPRVGARVWALAGARVREDAHLSVYACACACGSACVCRPAYVRVCVSICMYDYYIILLYAGAVCAYVCG